MHHNLVNYLVASANINGIHCQRFFNNSSYKIKQTFPFANASVVTIVAK